MTDASQSFEELQRGLQWRLLLGPEADNYSQLLLHELPACIPPVRTSHTGRHGMRKCKDISTFNAV